LKYSIFRKAYKGAVGGSLVPTWHYQFVRVTKGLI